MIEPENIKIMSIFCTAIVGKLAGTIAASSIGDDMIGTYIERGGTMLCIALLCYGIKQVANKLADREKRLDDMHDKEVATHQLSVEARITLASAQEKMANAIEKLTDKLSK